MKTKAPHSFNARINYAIGCLLDGTANNRAFEACFEMYDGMYIAIILTRRAEQTQSSKMQSCNGGHAQTHECPNRG